MSITAEAAAQSSVFNDFATAPFYNSLYIEEIDKKVLRKVIM